MHRNSVKISDKNKKVLTKIKFRHKISFNISILLSINEIQPVVIDKNNSDLDKTNLNSK